MASRSSQLKTKRGYFRLDFVPQSKGGNSRRLASFSIIREFTREGLKVGKPQTDNDPLQHYHQRKRRGAGRGVEGAEGSSITLLDKSHSCSILVEPIAASMYLVVASRYLHGRVGYWH